MEINPLDQRQAILAAIVDDSEDAIISKSLDSRITSWNKAAERMFGYTEQEMVGELIYKLIPPERYKEEEEIIAQLKQGKRVEHFETVRLTKTGRLLQISLTISPIKDTDGKIIGAAKIARDITRQKQYEDSLNVINELGKSINAQLDVDAILQIVTDATTRLSTASFGAFFYNKIDARGETYTLYALSGASREMFDKFGMPRKTAIFQPTFDGTAIMRSADITKDERYGKNAPHLGMPKGHLPVVSYMAVPVISRGEAVIGGLFFGHPQPNIFTEEHEMLVTAIASQAAIALDNAKMYHEVNVLNRRKDQFISFASHELKTPLTTLKGYLQLAHKTNMPFLDVYPKIEKQVGRLEEIITDLLDISLISAGKFDLNVSKVGLASLISESADSVIMQQHRLYINNPLAELDVWVDRQKIMQVLVNLLTNAAKYSNPESSIWLETELLGDEVKLSIRDEGMGIPAQHLDQIFNQFYRIQYPGSKAKGAGLGLFIGKEIMEAHLGKIWAESVVEKGSTFYIVFPIQRLRKPEAHSA